MARKYDPPAHDPDVWLFDLDNTLYPARCNLFSQIDVRIGRYIADWLKVTPEEARVVQKQYWRDHGTSMRGMMTLHGVDPTHYLDYVHDIDYSPVEANPALEASLRALPGRKIIFTAGDVPHAERVMERLGVAHHFEAIFDIAAGEYWPKPHPDLRRAGEEARHRSDARRLRRRHLRQPEARRRHRHAHGVDPHRREREARGRRRSQPHPSPDRRPRHLARRLVDRKEPQDVKILILGAGAVGGYWGARLTQAGIDTTFLLREKRAEKVRKEGLVVKSPKGDAVVPVKVVTRGSEGGPYDVIVLACKAYDLDSAMESIAPAVGPDTVIVPMLNGHAHFATLDAKFGAARVAGGLARISGMLGPNGEILHSGASGVSFGERAGKPARASLVELDAACKKAGIDGGLNDNINQDLWDKWIMLSTIAGMCASMRGTIGDIMESEDGAAIVAETLEESRKVAVAEGQPPSDKVVANLKGMLTAKGSKAVASILGDMEKGGAAEGKQIVGDMLARARKHGIAAPNLRYAYAHLQTYEARRARGGLK